MHTRRHFLRTVLVGVAASGFPGCGAQARARAGTGQGPGVRGIAKLHSERFEACHGVRDGEAFAPAAVSASHDVVIVGGGPSGLSAAYRLRDLDLLLLEKDEALGGNCGLDEWQGVKLSTGGAFYTESEAELVELFAEIGAPGLPVEGSDALVVDGEAVVDFFRDGAGRLPLPPRVRDDFRRSREDLLGLYRSRSPEELDRVTFASLLAPYDPVLTRFWDRFGRSNWGGAAHETSGFVGAEAYTWAGGAEDRRWTFPGGLAGGTYRLAEWLRPVLGGRLRTGAAVYRIEPEPAGAGAIVRYLDGGRPTAVRARVVIVALPKFFAAHVIPGLPQAQRDAMRAFGYAPFPVFNLCLASPGPEPAYDNWFLDAPFTDFIPADWIVHAGKGPSRRRTALTVYHPMAEARREELLDREAILGLVDGVADALERHFPGTLAKIEEVRVASRGHPMVIPGPGLFARAEAASRPFGPVLFANTDSAPGISSFDGALRAATAAAEAARARLAG